MNNPGPMHDDLLARHAAPRCVVRAGRVVAEGGGRTQHREQPRRRLLVRVQAGEQVVRVGDRVAGPDAVVVAVGAQGTKWLGLPGEGLPNVYHAKDLVYHYNGLPPYSERDFPLGDDVVVVGMGNVCLDIVHWLVCDKKVASVTAIARRGPGERAYTEKEMKIVSGALDLEQVRQTIEAEREAYQAVGQDIDALVSEITQHAGAPLEEGESPTTFRMRFLRSPLRLEGTDAGVESIVCEKTVLARRDDGSITSRGTGEYESIPCDTVVFAIGDSIEPSIGLPLEPRWKSNFMTVPDPWEVNPNRERYMVYDPETDTPMWGTFVVGWARKASDGLVGKARADAVQGCDEVIAYLRGEFPERPGAPQERDLVWNRLRAKLAERDVEFVDWQGVLRLLELENAIARKRQLPEYKFTTTLEMLDCIRESQP